ncbi:DUF2161 family putative PD-(D/E)XK-type phosphodiesterase [Sporomusa sp. KB1]|jgi:hypothetical protein|uniref:DUF2161 family putative PD-(D/E)XK-type phosphodiesterase n=1 Tax=Sporomusa sp. KB1 TaxID=943346 RepID=UPI0011A7FD05|nr:DUF2161 family putative PD-(D/E)XK-type phosphodiesterase [Sporomusa sp. KB1]
MMDKTTIINREEDLYIPVRDYLVRQGYTVKGEISYCDVTAINNAGILLVIEMKLRVNLEVILQAVQRQRTADIVYIAVPKNNKVLLTVKWRNICHLLRRLEIGLLLVTNGKTPVVVEEALAPEPFNREISRRSAKRKRKQLLDEFSRRHGDFNTGGSTGKKIVTAYREIAIHIAALLLKYGSLSVKQLKELGTDANKTAGILQNNYYHWFQRTARGVYCLTETGSAELKSYQELVNYYTGITK